MTLRRVVGLLLPALILLGGVGGFAALRASRPEPQPIASAERAWNVAVESVALSRRSPHLTLYGRVDARRIARPTAAITADVRELHVREGQRVEVGAPLVTLDDREAMLLVAQREAELADVAAQIANETERHAHDKSALAHEDRLLELARAEVERARELAASRAGSRSQHDQARQAEERQAMAAQQRRFSIREHTSRLARLEAQRERGRALLDLARLDARRTEVRAPFAGRVSRVDVSVGDRVRAGDPLVETFDTSTLELRAQIPLRYLPSVRDSLDRTPPLEARARVDDRDVEARLDRLGARVERGRGGADGLFRVTIGQEWLELGRVVEMIVSLPAEPDVVALPVEALYGLDRVFRVEDGRMRALPVERVGEIRSLDGGSRVLVRGESLRDGDRVIVTQLPNAADGLLVRIAEP